MEAGKTVPTNLPTIPFPMAGLRIPPGGCDRVMTPGRVEISDADFEALKAGPVTQHWLAPDREGKPQLVVMADSKASGGGPQQGRKAA
jgi:hypothetical protein